MRKIVFSFALGCLFAILAGCLLTVKMESVPQPSPAPTAEK